MKKKLLFLFFSLWCIWSGVNAQAMGQQRVTLDLHQASAQQMLNALRESTDYEFFYRLDDLADVPLRDYSFSGASLEQVMERLTSGTVLRWSLQEGMVTISRRTGTQQPQQAAGVVRGRVVDENGDALSGATVVVTGTSRGVISDANGEFQIDRIAGGAVNVTVSYVGMQTVQQTATVGQNTVIVLRVNPEALESVVVTGLFDRTAESFTGAARTISGAELARMGSGNVFQSLRNIDPSLNIMDNMEFGSDPNRMPEMELRGTSSFPLSEDDVDLRRAYQNNPNQPLFILNGFETSITRIFDLDMQRIQSITILKDAAAKAIYGAKAANGVVVIETRRSSGSGIVATYRGSVDIEMPDLTSYDLANSFEKLQIERLSGVYDSDQLSVAKANEILYNERLNAALAGVDTDWLSKPLRTGVGTRHSISLDVAREELSVLADVAYSNVAGVMKGSKRNTLQGSLDVAYRNAGKFLIRNIVNLSTNKSADSPYGSFQEYANMNPYYSPYDAGGNMVKRFSGQANPMYNARLNTTLGADYFNFSENLYAEYYPVTGMILRLRLGVETQRDETNYFYPADHTMFSGSEWTTEENLIRRGSYTNGVGRMNNLSGDLSLQYNKECGDHLLMTNFLYTMSESRSHWLDYRAEGFPSDKMNDMMFARQYAQDEKPTGWESIVRDIGFVGVVGYSYDSRYLADLTVRASASSKYSPKKRWGAFWSFGVAWNMHNETWAEELGWLERFKLRASIGTTGSQNVASNAHMVTYGYYTDQFYNGSRPYMEGAGTSIGASIIRLANEGLRWQEKLDMNIGFDAEIARRLSLVFDYYVSTTTNLVTDFTLPPSTGYFSILENIGKVENRGVDVNLTYRLINRPDFFLNITGAFSTNTNKIKELSDAMRHFNESQDKLVDDRTEEGARWKPVLRYVEGGSMTAIWAVPSLGINPRNGREIYVRPDGSTTYEWSSQYQQIVGDEREKYRGNFGFNGEYKGFGLSVTCRYLGGGELYNMTLVSKVENADVYANVDRRVFSGRWSEDNRYAPYKRLEPYNDVNGNYVAIPRTQPTSRFVQRRDELSIGSVSAYYDLGRLTAVRNTGLNRLRLAFNMNEIHTFSTIKAERGTGYPFARTMSFSLTAEF